MFGVRLGVGFGGITTLVCGLLEDLGEDVMDLIELEMAMTPDLAGLSEEEKEYRKSFASAQFVTALKMTCCWH